MTKYILSLFLTIFIVGQTIAGEKQRSFNRLYIGAGGTYSSGNIKSNHENSSVTYNNRGIGANILFGCGMLIAYDIYIGGEVAIGLTGSHFKNKVYSSKDKKFQSNLKSNSPATYNGVLHLGYAFNNFLAYTKMGYEYHSPVNVVGSDLSINRKGFVLGLGGDYFVSNKLFIRTEYHHNFGTRNKGINDDVKISTNTHCVLIGVGYKI